MIELKSSPLVLSLRDLYVEFRDIDPGLLDSILIDAKFDVSSTIEELHRRFRSSEGSNEPTNLSGRYKSIELHLGLSNPHREMRVVRLDTDVQTHNHR